MYDIIIIGGGLSGLTNSILLSRSGLSVALFEKKSYPFHRVCGEYISNEVKPFLSRNGIFPFELEPSHLSKFTLTSTAGHSAHFDLEMGGFGISRYSFDQFLVNKAIESGVAVHEKNTVKDIRFDHDLFHVESQKGSFQSKVVIGSFGKRSTLDAKMNRNFMKKRSPYIGVKHHIKTDFSPDRITLHNFKDGYCGISKVEGDTYNLCYLSHRDNLRAHGEVSVMEQRVLHKNPFLKDIWANSDFVFDQPLVINEVSFEKKFPVEDHIFMSGDSAGMITPLCGNGMAMAIHSAKILSETIIENWHNGSFNRAKTEVEYTKKWNGFFSRRLWSGRQIQRLFGSDYLSNIAVQTMKIKPLARRIVKLTHGPSV